MSTRSSTSPPKRLHDIPHSQHPRPCMFGMLFYGCRQLRKVAGEHIDADEIGRGRRASRVVVSKIFFAPVSMATVSTVGIRESRVGWMPALQEARTATSKFEMCVSKSRDLSNAEYRTCCSNYKYIAL